MSVDHPETRIRIQIAEFLEALVAREQDAGNGDLDVVLAAKRAAARCRVRVARARRGRSDPRQGAGSGGERWPR